jgi:hypothetical protein
MDRRTKVRAKENDNDTNYLCDGGRGFAFRGRFRDFAGGADCAAAGRRHDW